MDNERTRNKGFSYESFLESLSSNGENSRLVSEKVLGLMNDGKVKVVQDSNISLSTVSLIVEGVSTIYLPQSYSNEKALFEAPRVLLDVLRISSDFSPQSLPNIENGFRQEFPQKT